MGESGSENLGHMAFEGSKSHELTPAKTRFFYAMRKLFPNMPIAGWNDQDDEELVKQWGWVMAPGNVREQGLETRSISYSQKNYGRSDYIPLVFAANDGTKFLVMYRKGVGGANSDVGDFNGDRFKQTDKNRPNAGLADELTTFIEASERSELLHNNGIRVRLPVMAFYVDEVMTKEGLKTIKELVELGSLDKSYLDNPPVMSYWARRSPFTFSDANLSDDVAELLKSQIKSLRNEGTKQTNHVAREIEKGRGEKAWFNWLTDLGASQLAKYAKIGLIHHAFHGQNITLAIETGDLGDESESFDLKPLTKESSDEDKNLFVDQTVSMLREVVILKEHFMLQQDKIPVYGEMSDDVRKLVDRFVVELGNSESGRLMLKQMVDHSDRIQPEQGVRSLFEPYMIEKANKVLWKKSVAERGKALLGFK